MVLELVRNETVPLIYIVALLSFNLLIIRSFIKERKNPLSNQVSRRIQVILSDESGLDKGRAFFEQRYKNLLDRIDKRLKKSDLNFTAEEFLTFNLIGISVGIILGVVIFPFKTILVGAMFFVSDPISKITFARITSGIFFGSLGFFLPNLIALYRERKRKKELEDQLINFILSMADAIGTAYTPQQSIGMVADEIADPLGKELKRAATEIQTQIPYEDVLENLSERINLEEYRLILTSMKIQARTGGHLESMLRNSARIAEERRNTKDEVMQVINSTSNIAYFILVSPWAALLFISYALGEEFTDHLFSLMGAIYFGVLSVVYVIGAIGVLAIRKSIIKLL